MAEITIESQSHPTTATSAGMNTSSLYLGPTAEDIARIPAELRERRHWVCWRGVQESTRLNKPPYAAHPPYDLAKVNDPSTWDTLETACEALPLLLSSWVSHAGYAGGGIGCMVTEPYVGVDFDKCRDVETGTLEPWAQHLVNCFSTYTEVSPSLTGVKLWCKGKLPEENRKTKYLEVYDHGRYFTVTGIRVAQTPAEIFLCQDLLTDFYTVLPILDTCLKRTGPARERFSLLFAGRWHDTRDTKGQPYSSQSEADMAFANVCTNAGATETQLDTLWRLSGLYRGKTEKPSYRTSTARKAQRPYQKPTNTNHPRGEKDHTSAAEDADQRQNGHAPAGERPTTGPNIANLLYTDNYNAAAFVREHGQHLRYVYPWKSWLVWNGRCWERDASGAIMRLATQTVKRLARHLEDLDDAEAKALLKHIKASLSTAKRKAMVEWAQSEEGIPVQPEDLDNDIWALNVQNGTIDLKTGKSREHRQGDLLTKVLPLAYDPTAQCPLWQRFLWRIMGGSQGEDTPDMPAGELENRRLADERAQRLITFLQRSIGYSLTGDTREQCLFVLHGSGSNGKSTFLETLQALLGDYAQSTPSASLLAKDRHDGIPNDIARLRGARLVTAVEIGEGKRLNEELVKRLTGQDTLTARFLFAEFFDFRAEFKLHIACNHLPQIRGTDHAIWRRIKCIPFTVTIPDEEQDKDLPGKLKTELLGILRWAVQGCLDWQREGLATPKEVRAATKDYRDSMDVIGRFIEECCLVSPQVQAKASDLYDAYKTWCEASGEYAVTLTAFGNRLEEKGFTKHKAGTIWRRGIGLQVSTAT